MQHNNSSIDDASENQMSLRTEIVERRKKVTFNRSTRTKYHETSKNTLRNTWYSPKDKASFIDDIKTNLKEFYINECDIRAFDDKKYCFRGLEEKIDRNCPNNIRKRRQFVQQILKLQEEQKRDALTDDEELMLFSQSSSKAACMYARQKALEDTYDARRIANEHIEKRTKTQSVSMLLKSPFKLRQKTKYAKSA